jgi:putative peptidoglycan lipid II flippase
VTESAVPEAVADPQGVDPEGVDPQRPDSGGAERAGLVRSSAAVAVGTLLSRVTGFVRIGVLAAALGQATLSDTYHLANTTPNIIYELLVGGVLAATLVPVFVEQIQKRNDRSVSVIFTIVLSALALFTAITMVFTPVLARVFALGSSGSQHAAQVKVLTVLILCFVPQIVFYGFTTLASALLNAHRRFVAAAYAPVLNNVVVIGILVVFIARTANRNPSVTDAEQIRDDLDLLLLLGVGTTAGIVAMALALVVPLRRAHGRIGIVLTRRDPVLRTILRLSGWTVGYVVANQVAQIFVLLLAKSGQEGDASAYIYAFAFYVVAHGVIAVSIMTVMMPRLAQRAAAGDGAGLRREFGGALRYIVVLILPAAVVAAVLAQPMLSIVVFKSFTASDAALTADLLQVFALSLVPFSVYLFAIRAFYSLQNTRTPFFLNLFENGCNIVLAIVLYPMLGVQGLAWAWGLAYLLAAVASLWSLRTRVGRLPASVASSAGRAAIAAAAMVVVTALVSAAIGDDSRTAAVVATITATVAGGLVYLGVLAALRADEMGELWVIVRRRGVQSSPADS